MYWSKVMAAALLVATSALAGEVDFKPLTQACEEALALSALPAAMRERASVYVWKDGDFVKTKSSDGGFHCIVQRNHPESIIPECITATGESSILEGIKERTRLVAAGIAPDEAEAKVLSRIEAGEIAGPDGPGVNYMMSAYNRIYTSRADAVGEFPPHTMFFAPGANAEVVGGSYQMARDVKGFPMVVEALSHSYIMTFTDDAAESEDVEKACKGQIDTGSPYKS